MVSWSASRIPRRRHSAAAFMTSVNRKPSAASVREPTYSISELAHEFALTTRAIRFYEDEGMLAPERRGSARVYRERERVRLKLILRGKRLGLSLSEIRELLDLYEIGRNERAQLAKFIDVLVDRRGAPPAAEGGHRRRAGRDRRGRARMPAAAEGGRRAARGAGATPPRLPPHARCRGRWIDVYVNVIDNRDRPEHPRAVPGMRRSTVAEPPRNRRADCDDREPLHCPRSRF